MSPAPPGHHLFALEIDYSNSGHRTIGAEAASAKAISTLFDELGFELADTERLRSATAREIVDAIEDWACPASEGRGEGDGRGEDRGDGRGRQGSRRHLVLFLAGHGELHHRQYYLMVTASPTSPPWNSRNAINIDLVAEHLLDAPVASCIVLLDTCNSGFGANEIAARLAGDSEDRTSGGVDIGVLASALPLEKAYEGEFVGELIDALTNGSRLSLWSPAQETVTLYELRDELRERLGEEFAYTAGQSGLMLANPAANPARNSAPVLLRQLLADLPATDREHFLSKAAGADANDLGWYFSGRRSATQRLLDWLAQHPDGGVYVVTGSPGAGKSALLGRLAALADPKSQRACRLLGMFDDETEPRPEPGLFDAVVHARNLDAARISLALGDQLGIDVAEASRPEVALRAGLVASGRAVTVLIDAIDEADPGQHDTVTMGIIRAIGSLPGCRVVAGSRRDRSGTYQTTGDDDEGPLLEAMRPSSAPMTVDDLDRDPETDRDIRHYIESRLADGKLTEEWPTEARRRQAAEVVSAQAERLFLYARFALKVLAGRSEGLVDEAGWDTALPADTGRAGLRQVFAQDLARYGHDADRITEVLRPLAFGQGEGLPQRVIWPELATELASPELGGSGRFYGQRDVGYVIREAAWYLVETTVDGEAVFRLYHQAIADALREELLDAD